MENFKILKQLKEINKSIIRLTDYIIETNDKTNSYLVLLIKSINVLLDFMLK